MGLPVIKSLLLRQSPVIKTLPSNAGNSGSKLDHGAKIPHASWSKNQNIKQKNIVTKLIKTSKKMVHIKKKKKKNLKSVKHLNIICFSSVQFSRLVVSDSATP